MKIGKYKTVYSLLRNPARWTRRAAARDEKGRKVDPQSPEAVQFCLVGACDRVYGAMECPLQALFPAIEAEGHLSIAQFNDNVPHATMLRAVKLAGI